MSVMKKAGKILFLPLTLLNKLIPKKAHNVLFYSNLGFRDNVKAMYDHMITEGYNREFNITVSTDEFERYQNSAPENVKFVSLKKGIVPFLFSKYVFYSFGKYPIKPARDQKVVNLWHGMPLKRIGRLEAGHERDKQNYFTDVIATSPFFAEVMKKAFGAENKQVILTSQPRCDDMFKETKKPDSFSDYSKVIFWLPTFSNSSRLNKNDNVHYDEVNPYDVTFLERVNEALKKQNMLLVIKPHPMDDADLSKIPFSNLFYVTDDDILKKGYSLYSFLSHTDALITDFSSIYFDFLMLNRPIAFAGLDFEEYRKNRGFVVDDVSELMPGCHIDCEEEFLDFLKSVSRGEDNYKEKREECNAFVNSFAGGGCERVLKHMGLTKNGGKLK
ncbi:MAG: CDP-glycerol glycerophosphotransferase family protein [Oscillospiraceae bacterium]|nr:CDP-glycerol glycerophosphotransferase family protein [Oscillospiraceae bacterium]MBQ8869730.1 CDP-glycerol glycerophosphotransferase family protein [Oscillospiraceae bacterium]